MLIKPEGKALRRPVLSPDGTTLAVIAPDDKIHLIDLAEAAKGRKFINALKITKSTRPFIRTCTILRWSPEVVFAPNDEAIDGLSSTTSECDFGKSWLLASDGRRVIALSTDIRSPRMMPTADEEGGKSNILADYDLGDSMGVISLVEFVFNHRNALVVAEIGSAAAILDLSRPQRDDIPYVKFPDARSLAKAPDSRYFALLRREKAQDRVTVFHLSEENKLVYKSFDSDTTDAQDVTWCPTGQPLLAVLESPAYGVKVSFFTAQGQHLYRYDISAFALHWSPELSPLVGGEGVGLTHWDWRKASRSTKYLNIQVLANGQRQVALRYQSSEKMGIRPLAQIEHPNSINGSKTFVWVESNGTTAEPTTTFARQTGTSAVAESPPSDRPKQQSKSDQAKAEDPHHVDTIELNSNHTIVATRLRGSPRTLFLWRPLDTSHPHSVLVFRHAVRQIHFHPYLPHVLIIITNSKKPRIYAWYQHDLPPTAGEIPIDTSLSTKFSGMWLPDCVGECNTDQANSMTKTAGQRCPFLFTSNTAFEAGLLSSHEGRVVFESILHRHSQRVGDTTLAVEDYESTSELIDTPSRPSRQVPDKNGNGLVKKARFDVPDKSETDLKNSPIHEEAGYAYAW